MAFIAREIKSTSISVIKMISQNYINKIKEILNTSKIIETVEIVKEKAIQDQGYFRAKITLKNGDFLEVAEFFKIENKQCISADYRYQWMNVNKEKLIKRWDNVKHFPDLANFPHHVHISDESIVKPSKLRSTIEIISLIEQKILKKNN